MRVAIIGGGVSGLTTAKSLIDFGIKPVIFEASNSIGGLWNPSNKRLWKSLNTNLSKFTCSLFDHPWSKDTAVFPSSAVISDYLQSYCDKHISNECVKLQSTVTKVTKTKLGLFELQWKDISNQVYTSEFDKVVVASGFFKNSITTPINTNSFTKEILYSNEYQSPESFENKNVVIIGGSFTGSEIAAEVAKHAKKVYHIVPHHAYVVPRYLADDLSSPSPSFLPIDVVFYQLTNERKEKVKTALTSNPKQVEILFKDKSEIIKTHEYFRRLIGTKSNEDVLSTLRSDLTDENEQIRSAHVIISDEYKNMVNCGAIKIIPGKLLSLDDTKLIVEDTTASKSSVCIDECVDSCIVCTGFQPNLSFLDDELLRTLHYQPENSFLPVLLHEEMMHPAIDGMYFVGMYRGTYFGVIQFQAKLAAAYISGQTPLPSQEELLDGIEVAKRIRAQHPVPQFPHSDYMGMLFQLSQKLNIAPSLQEIDAMTLVTPHVFQTDPTLKQPMQDSLDNTIQSYREGSNVGRFIAYALEGSKYTFTREILEKDTGNINTVNGTISFQRIDKKDNKLWYHETGVFHTAQRKTFEVSQSYIYQFNEELQALEIFFSVVGKPTEIDRHFLTLKCKPSPHGWIAEAKHLCGEDNYIASYCFTFQGMTIQAMKIVFDVLGPSKNYRSTTIVKAE